MFTRLGVSVIALTATTLGACASTVPPVEPVPYVVGSMPFRQQSPLMPAYDCLREEIQPLGSIRVSVSDIKDKTGKVSYEAAQGGSLVSQAGTEMVITALSYLGPNVRQLERFDTTIPQTELALSRQQLIRDGDRTRGVTSGMYEGSDYYISGSISNINQNIRTGGFQAEVNQIGFRDRYYVMDVRMDLRLVRTHDMAIIAVSSPTKQIVGREVGVGVFSFFGDYLIDINAGTRDQEALQLGARTALEYGVLELMPYAFNSTQPRRCIEFADQMLSIPS